MSDHPVIKCDALLSADKIDGRYVIGFDNVIVSLSPKCGMAAFYILSSLCEIPDAG